MVNRSAGLPCNFTPALSAYLGGSRRRWQFSINAMTRSVTTGSTLPSAELCPKFPLKPSQHPLTRYFTADRRALLVRLRSFFYLRHPHVAYDTLQAGTKQVFDLVCILCKVAKLWPQKPSLLIGANVFCLFVFCVVNACVSKMLPNATAWHPSRLTATVRF